jgi:photosystem II stability/assembly factor-like uncharacterized protein
MIFSVFNSMSIQYICALLTLLIIVAWFYNSSRDGVNHDLGATRRRQTMLMDFNSFNLVKSSNYCNISLTPGNTSLGENTKNSPILVASSGDGKRLLAVAVNRGGVYTSNDFGLTWLLSLSPNTFPNLNIESWSGADISDDDGSYLVVVHGNAVTDQGHVLISSNFGRSWAPVTSIKPKFLKDVHISSNGERLVAIATQSIAVSHNFGIEWQFIIVPVGCTRRNFGNIVLSGDGKTIAATCDTDHIVVSVDFGSTWVLLQRFFPESTDNCAGILCIVLTDIATSYDGRRLAAVYWEEKVVDSMFTSANSGLTWKSRHIESSDRGWRRILSSYDGKVLYAIDGNNNLFVSCSGGSEWVVFPALKVANMAVSADGSSLMLVAVDGTLHGARNRVPCSSGIENASKQHRVINNLK